MIPRRWFLLLLLLAWTGGWWWLLSREPAIPVNDTLPWTEQAARQKLGTLPVNTRFDFPVRPPAGEGAWTTVRFGSDHHLGEDWNTAEGDADLGEPVYSCGDGWVLQANDYQSVYGKVLIIIYRLPANAPFPGVEMMYANLDTLMVDSNQPVRRGQKIGTMGTAEGTNRAHLHWEVRSRLGLGLGAGYYDIDNTGWLDPRRFVEAYSGGFPCRARQVPPADYERWGSD